MAHTQVLSKPRSSEILLPLISAFIIVNFLFFIDEGYYDFRWMADAGNWFVFGIYMIIFFPIEFLISQFVIRRIDGWKKVLAMVLLTITIAMGLLWIF